MNKTIPIIAVILTVFALLLFGCTALDPNAEKKSLEQFSKLQTSYGVKENFSPVLGTMNDYVTDLSAIAGSAPMSTKKFIEAELYSAESFYYLNKAINESRTINYQNIKCSDKEVKSTREMINLASSYQTKAVSAISTLNDSELKNLRPNQAEIVNGIEAQITPIKDYFDKKC
jgi:hypothetical protein